MRMRTNEALIGTPAGVVKARTIWILPEDEKWSAAMILEVRGTPRRPNPLVDDENVPEEIDEIMSDIVPRTATEEAWRSMYVTRRLILYGETPGCPGCKSIGEKNGPSHSTECRQRLQNEMSTTRETKIKLDEEQKRRDAPGLSGVDVTKVNKSCSYSINDSHSWIEGKFDHGHHV